MQIIEEEKRSRALLDGQLDSLIAVSVESLIRADELGTSLNFAKGTEIFRRVLKLGKELREANLDAVPTKVLVRLTEFLRQMLASFQRIQQFDPGTQGNPGQARDSLIQEVFNLYQESFLDVASVVSFSIRKGTDFEKLENDAKDLLKSMTETKSKQETRLNDAEKEIAETISKMRQAAAEVGVVQHNVHFRDQAKEHLNKTRPWLITTVVLAAATVLYGAGILAFYLFYNPTFTPTQSLQVAIAKLVVFSMLSIAALWSGKIYRSHWHNYIVNKHRQNALSTFETFVKGASDDQTKNAVLLQATQCIFAQVHSGFAGGTEAEPGSSPHVLEIIRGVTATAGTK